MHPNQLADKRFDGMSFTMSQGNILWDVKGLLERRDLQGQDTEQHFLGSHLGSQLLIQISRMWNAKVWT